MLKKIVEVKKQEVKSLSVIEPQRVKHYSLFEALNKPNRQLGLIAEVKKGSPSKGIIKADFNPIKIAKEYECGKADALSVLTDEQFFFGHHTYLSQIKQEVELPVLRKDFIISSKQIDQSLQMGADAILLIATILEKSQLHEYYLEAYEKGMECLVEVHDTTDVEKVFSSFQPAILGINNRNLKTFETDVHHTLQMVKEIPENVLVVSESGISDKNDIKKLLGNTNAILVGETLMRATTPILGIETLFGEK